MEIPKVGETWVSRYCYGNIIYTFYKVLKVTAKTAIFQPLEKVGWGNYNGGDYWVRPVNENAVNGRPFTKRLGKEMSMGFCHWMDGKWSGEPLREAHGMD